MSENDLIVSGKKPKKAMFWKWLTGFIVLVIVLTFFSRTIYNFSLPTVTISTAKQGSISHDISGNSYVLYQNTRNLYTKENGWIEKISVSIGDEVSKGQVLMTIKTEGNEAVEILAPQNGIILTIGIQEGMHVMAAENKILSQMAAVNGKWKAELELTEEQFGELAQGEKALVQINGKSENISGQIENVTSYTNASGENGYAASIIFENSEDIAGKQATVTIPKKSENFDVIIPSYALHKDESGYYILSLEEKTSVLGKQYIVERVSVDLLDTDDTSVAIMGINADTLVIEAGTTEISAGMRVMYEESGE